MGSVKLEKVVKCFGEEQTIHGVDIEVEDGEFVVFVGPSGCGKSTLLRMVAGLETITDGKVFINNQCVNELQPAGRGIAMVFQSYALYPHMTVRENIAFSMKLAKIDKETMNHKVNLAAKSLQLEPLLDRKPANMSGGQRQRVAIGRAIVRDPQVFLFDEPLSNLDAELRVQMRLEIARLHKELGATMLYVTHDQVEAMTLADKIVVLSAGRVEQVGTPLDLYKNPDNLFVAGFIGSPKMNFLQGKIKEVSDELIKIRLNDDSIVSLPVNSRKVTKGATVIVGVRPEHLKVNGLLPFVITVIPDVVENLGGHSFLYSKLDNEPVSVEIEGIYEQKDENKITLSADFSDVHLFDDAGKVIR